MRVVPLDAHARTQWQTIRTEAVMSTLVSSRSDRETVDESELVEDDESVMLLYIPELCVCHHTRMYISQCT
jgi:hypothetical protein